MDIDLSIFDNAPDADERCGVVMRRNDDSLYVVEVPNRAENPYDDFIVWVDDVPESSDGLFGVVHTHPANDSPFPSKNDLASIPAGLVGIVYHPATKSVVRYDRDGLVTGQVNI